MIVSGVDPYAWNSIFKSSLDKIDLFFVIDSRVKGKGGSKSFPKFINLFIVL